MAGQGRAGQGSPWLRRVTVVGPAGTLALAKLPPFETAAQAWQPVNGAAALLGPFYLAVG